MTGGLGLRLRFGFRFGLVLGLGLTHQFRHDRFLAQGQGEFVAPMTGG